MADDYDLFTQRMTSFDMVLGDEDPMAHADDPIKDVLAHYGVKGMQWGKRKSDSSSSSGAVARFKSVRNIKPQTLELKSKSGETVTVRENKKPLISAFAAAAHPKLHENIMNSSSVGLFANGKKIGDADYTFQGKNRDELYLNMIQVHPKHRGKGYASTVLDAAVEMGQKEGAKKITLDVPGNAPDAKHIYTKLGFKDSGPAQKGADYDVMWGGLTPMELDISSRSVKHADEDPYEVADGDIEKAFEQHFQKLYAPVSKPKEGGDVEHTDTGNFLAHYGVKGMKWGQKKAAREEKKAQAKYERSSEDARAAESARTKMKTSSVDSLSNKELQTLVTRMNLEQQLSGLQEKTKVKSAGRKFVEDIARDQARQSVSGALKNTVGKAVQIALEDQINKKLKN